MYDRLNPDQAEQEESVCEEILRNMMEQFYVDLTKNTTIQQKRLIMTIAIGNYIEMSGLINDLVNTLVTLKVAKQSKVNLGFFAVTVFSMSEDELNASMKTNIIILALVTLLNSGRVVNVTPDGMCELHPDFTVPEPLYSHVLNLIGTEPKFLKDVQTNAFTQSKEFQPFLNKVLELAKN